MPDTPNLHEKEPLYTFLVAELVKELPPLPVEWDRYAVHKALRRAMATARNAASTEAPFTSFSDEPSEVCRELEKLAQDYQRTFWSLYITKAAQTLRRMLRATGVPLLPAAEIVAQHMHMSEGAVRMTYAGIQAVAASGGKLPAVAQMDDAREAAEAADRAAIPHRRPVTTAVQAVTAPPVVQHPIARRPVSAPKETATIRGFFG